MTSRHLSFLALLASASLVAAVQPVYESPKLTTASTPRLVKVDASLKGAKELYLVVSDEDGISCDWADWLEPKLIMADGSTKDLTQLKWKAASQGSGGTRLGKSTMGDALLVKGQKFERGIGTHARSVIVYDLPQGVERFTAQAAIDDGGMERGGKASNASVKFQVYTETPPNAPKPAPPIVDDGKTTVPADMFNVPEGLEVTVWATSPALFNPTNIDFDAQGRLWVAEGVNYRSKGSRRPEGDRVVVLEDTTGSGKADKSSVFVQESALAAPLGVAVLGNKIVVSQPPDLLVYTDVNGDGKFDPAVDKRDV
ncbi:MAG: rane-bound dehydrogenase domain protein, partial [Prosthecobacter sp.]|nr:rane-bound dehydrogenase domain protein [Prosthecobacter sp.]